MVNQSMVLAEKPVLGFDPDADFANSAGFVNAEFGVFASPEELDEYLRTFAEGGNGDEAEIQTQGTDDIGGEPTTTVH